VSACTAALAIRRTLPRPLHNLRRPVPSPCAPCLDPAQSMSIPLPAPFALLSRHFNTPFFYLFDRYLVNYPSPKSNSARLIHAPPSYSSSPSPLPLFQDLASVDRSVTPWVIVTGHRPMYSSSTGFAVDPAPVPGGGAVHGGHDGQCAALLSHHQHRKSNTQHVLFFVIAHTKVSSHSRHEELGVFSWRFECSGLPRGCLRGFCVLFALHRLPEGCRGAAAAAVQGQPVHGAKHKLHTTNSDLFAPTSSRTTSQKEHSSCIFPLLQAGHVHAYERSCAFTGSFVVSGVESQFRFVTPTTPPLAGRHSHTPPPTPL
jgi:hypothetical protein